MSIDDRPRRRRLGVQERREQLIAVAAGVFAAVPYEDAQVEDIARRAGVSEGLVYHHFGSKRGLFAAVVDHAIDELGEMAVMPEDLPLVDRMRAGMDGYLDYIQKFEQAYRAMHRGRESGDQRIRAAIERNTQRQIANIAAVVVPGQVPSPALRLALRGALAMTISACLDWLETREIDQNELREVLLHGYLGAVEGAMFPERTPDDRIVEVVRALA